MPEEPGQTFDPREILLALAEHGVDYVVVGGVAVWQTARGGGPFLVGSSGETLLAVKAAKQLPASD